MKQFIKLLSKRARFSEKDTKILIDEMIAILEEYASKGKDLNIRRMGKLYRQILPVRKGKDGIIYPEAVRTVFRLSENIRYAHKKLESINEEALGSDEELGLTDE